MEGEKGHPDKGYKYGSSDYPRTGERSGEDFQPHNEVVDDSPNPEEQMMRAESGDNDDE